MSKDNDALDAALDNEHIKKYLRWYLSFRHSPKYAVMLNGAWGIGKTYLIARLLEEFDKNETQFCHISLFGVANTSDIDDALLRAIHPYIFSKAGKMAGHVAKAAASIFKVSSTIDVGEFVDKFKAQIYIFDDLERCEMSINRVMGYINSFVEHEGCKVVIIANENEISSADIAEFNRRKEKIVGKTFEVQSEVEVAINDFMGKVDDSAARNFLVKNKQAVLLIYKESEAGNLRILQQTIWDFERFYTSIPDIFKAKEAGLIAVLRLFFVFLFELKTGRVTPDQLRKRKINLFKMLKAKNTEELEPFEKANYRYTGIDLGDFVFSDALIEEVFLKGLISVDRIADDFSKSKHFVDPQSEPSWRIVWERDVREVDVVERAIVDLEEKFAARYYESIGEILHVFGLRLSLVDDGLLSFTKEEIIIQAKSYADDLRSAGRLHFNKSNSEFIIGSGSFGLGYSEHGTCQFKELYDYVKAKGVDGVEATYPQKAEELLAEMRADHELFWRRINYSNTSDGTYAGISIMKYINTDRFVEVFMSQSAASQRSILMAIHTRYEHNKITSQFADEADWLKEIASKILAIANQSNDVLKTRLARLHKWMLDPLLK